MRKTADKVKKKKIAMSKSRRSKGFAVIGIDISMQSVAGAVVGFDRALDEQFGMAVQIHRWPRETEYFTRLKEAARAEEFISKLLVSATNCSIGLEDVYIGVEEPFPLGIIKRLDSGWVKQQAQISGAFLGGLVRYGFQNIYEVNNMSWKASIARELGGKVTKDFKWQVKPWAMEAYDLDDFPDLIQTARGLEPKPASSRAQPKQPDDRYDAAGVCAWLEQELQTSGVLDMKMKGGG